jgi:hypothetical protein
MHLLLQNASNFVSTFADTSYPLWEK